jgi:hypothetical protein
MRLKEFAHGFDLSRSVDSFFRKGSFGKPLYIPTGIYFMVMVDRNLPWGLALE